MSLKGYLSKEPQKKKCTPTVACLEESGFPKLSIIKICILLNVMVPELEYAGEVWEGNKKLADKLETVQMPAAEKILGCSKTTSNTALRAELGMYAFKTET